LLDTLRRAFFLRPYRQQGSRAERALWSGAIRAADRGLERLSKSELEHRAGAAKIPGHSKLSEDEPIEALSEAA
jgi:hypothetical protein